MNVAVEKFFHNLYLRYLACINLILLMFIVFYLRIKIYKYISLLLKDIIHNVACYFVRCEGKYKT